MLLQLDIDLFNIIFIVQTQSVSELKDFVRRLHSLPEIAVSLCALHFTSVLTVLTASLN